jgi:Flp pilus assembly protein TadG
VSHKSLQSAGVRVREESGVVLVLVAICMVVFLGMAALAIDLGSFRQAQAQAQNAADAAALAAAQDLPGNPTTATVQANTYVQKDLPGATAVVTTPYNSDSGQVKVTVNATTPSFAGRIFGVTSAAVSASAVAGVKTTSTPVVGPIFAGSTNCSAITLQNNNNAQVGGIVTNGGVSVSGSNGTTDSSLSYGPGCSAPTGQAGVTFATIAQNNGLVPYPIDYRSQTITCNAGESVTNTGGTYSYGVSSLDFNNNQVLSGVYCAQNINLSDSKILSGSATFIADNFGGGISDTGTLTPYFNHLLLWQTGSSTMQLNSPTFVDGGVIFAPSAEILVNSQAMSGGVQYALFEGDSFWMSSMNGGSLQAPAGLTSGSTTGSPALTG